MRIRHIDRSKLVSPASGTRPPWLETACNRLLGLPDHPRSRILVAVDGGRTCAVLGLELKWADNGRLRRATIRVLAVDPDHDDWGVGSRLVRFAEDIAHINGCDCVHMAPDLDNWGGKRCWSSLGYNDVMNGVHRNTTSPIPRRCA